MDNGLTKRELTALEKLTFECDYEDAHKGGTDNFILRNKLAPGIGDKTISSLTERGFVITGPHRWSDRTGFRITDNGRKALAEHKPKQSKRRTTLGTAPDRLNPMRPRIK